MGNIKIFHETFPPSCRRLLRLSISRNSPDRDRNKLARWNLSLGESSTRTSDSKSNSGGTTPEAGGNSRWLNRKRRKESRRERRKNDIVIFRRDSTRVIDFVIVERPRDGGTDARRRKLVDNHSIDVERITEINSNMTRSLSRFDPNFHPGRGKVKYSNH